MICETLRLIVSLEIKFPDEEQTIIFINYFGRWMKYHVYLFHRTDRKYNSTNENTLKDFISPCKAILTSSSSITPRCMDKNMTLRKKKYILYIYKHKKQTNKQEMKQKSQFISKIRMRIAAVASCSL